MPADGAARVRFLFHCWLLLIAAAALCDEAAAQGSACGKLDSGQVDPVPDAEVQIKDTVNFLTLDWLPPDDDYDIKFYYIVRCPTCPTKQDNTTDETYTFSNLTAASEYNLTIQAGRWNCRLSTLFYLLSERTGLTNIPDPVHFSNVAETSFRAHWAASPDAGVLYEVSCAGIVQGTSALCTGLSSGARIQVTVRPVKTGFPPGSFIYGTALTKLFPIHASSAQFVTSETAISVSWQAPNIADASYQLICRRVGSSDVTNVTSSSPSATCGSLESGRTYELTVAVKKEGGFDDAVTQLPNQLTMDGEAGAVAELRLLSVPGGEVGLSWKPLSPTVGQGVVFEYALRLDGPGGCAAAFQLNCSDCGRHRKQLQSDEARQRLEDLTRNCAAPVSVRAFSFYDTELVLEVPVSSEGGSPNSLQPWTEYSASLWPVNLAGPGAVRSVPFRSPETPSGAVRSLQATPSEAEALVEFEEPELANGLLQAFAVQVLTAHSVCSQLLVLNSTYVGCQLPNCATAGILFRFSQDCSSTQHVSSGGNGSSMTVKVQQLQPGTEYLVRVTPVSQTLQGAAVELHFVTVDRDGGGSTVAIVVSTVVSVLAVLAIGAAVLVFVRHRQQNSAPQQTAPASNAAHNLPRVVVSEYATVNEPTAKPTDYVEIVPGKGEVRVTQQTAPASNAADNLANDVFSEYATVDVDTPTNYVEIVPVRGQVRYKS